MSDPKKHHFLPQFYLEGFQIQDRTSGKIPHVHVFEKSAEAKSFICSIKDTGCKTDYNTIERPDGTKDRSSVEQQLSIAEGIQDQLLKKITTARRIEPSDLADLAFFVLLMRNRVPKIKDYIEESLQRVIQSTAMMLYKKGRFPPPPKEIEELVAKGENPFHAKIANFKILEYMLKIATDKKVLSILSAMSFSLIEAQENCFMTSDTPVAFYVPNYESRRPYGVGIVDKEIEITIPLNSRYLLLGSWQRKEPFFYATSTDVAEYNRRVIIMAKNYVYASINNEDTLNLIQKFSHLNAGFDIFSGDFQGGSVHISRFIPVTAMADDSIELESVNKI